jgi:flagellar motor switch protein FliG
VLSLRPERLWHDDCTFTGVETQSDPKSGLNKAAILLLSLGEQEAAQVLTHLSAPQVQSIGVAMAALSAVSREQISEVLNDFNAESDQSTSLAIGADGYIRNILNNALGPDKAKGVIDRILGSPVSKGMEALKWLDAPAIAEVLRFEHPQIAAMVLSYLDRAQAAAVLAVLPEGIRSDLIVRVATLGDIQPAAMEHLDRVIAEQFSGTKAAKTSGLGGLKAAAEILNLLGAGKSTALLEEITKADEPLAGRIQELMFVFEDLAALDDRSMQELVRRVTSDKLLLALKAASEEMKTKVFKNMSQRAAETLKEDLAAQGPVKLSEVEAAQKEILVAAREAAESGAITLGSSSGEAMV